MQIYWRNVQFHFYRFRSDVLINLCRYSQWLILYESKLSNDVFFIILDYCRYVSCARLVRLYRFEERCIDFSFCLHRCFSREFYQCLNDFCSCNQLDLQLSQIWLLSKFEIQLYIEHSNIRFRVDLTLDQFNFLLYIMSARCSIKMYKFAFVDIEARIVRLILFFAFAIYLFWKILSFKQKSMIRNSITLKGSENII